MNFDHINFSKKTKGVMMNSTSKIELLVVVSHCTINREGNGCI